MDDPFTMRPKPPSVQRRLMHASLNHRADNVITADALADTILDLSAHYCSTTEGRPTHVRRLRKRLGNEGYTVRRRGEFIFIWHRAAYHYVPRKSLGLRILTATPRIEAWRQFLVGRVDLLDVDAGVVGRFEAGHGPGGVEMGDGWRKDSAFARQQVKTAQAGWPKWGRQMNRAARRHDEGAWMGWASFDGNLDWKRQPWRQWLNQMMGGEPVWYTPNGLPSSGTHGARLIDGAIAYGAVEVERGHVITRRMPPGNDHRWWYADVEVTIAA